MILINRFFEIVTQDSAELGKPANSGVLASNDAVTFRELVAILRDGQACTWPATGDTREWVSKDQGETYAFFAHGARESHSIHYSRDNPAHKARYWRLAFIAAGLIRPTVRP